MKSPRLLLALLLVAVVFPLRAQIVDLPYGAPISLPEAKRVLAAAQAEAVKNKWAMAISIVDAGGHLVAFERMDTTQHGSIEVSQQKAQTAVAFRRPSKAFQDNVAAGGEGLRTLRLPGALPIEGGVPIVVGGKIVGAIGVSGGTAVQDGQVAAAGLLALRG